MSTPARPIEHLRPLVCLSWIALLSVAVLASAGCRSPSAPQKPAAAGPSAGEAMLTERQRQLNLETFDVVWTTVRDRHYDPTLNGVDWQAVRERLRPQMEAATTMSRARSVLGEMLATLGQSHMAILPAEAYLTTDPDAAGSAPPAAASAGPPPAGRPSTIAPAGKEPSSPGATRRPDRPAERVPGTTSRAENAERAENADAEPGSVGLELRIIDGRAIVFRVGPASPADRAGVRPGWEVVSVGRREIRPLLTRLAAMPTQVGLPLSALQAMAVRSLLTVDVGEAVHVGFLDAQDRARVVTLVGKTPAGAPIRFGQLPTEYLDIVARRIPSRGPAELPPPDRGGIGYFAFNIWLDPVRVNSAFENLLRDIDSADGLIIDLRGNPGGLGAMAMGLGGYLVTQRNLVLGETRLRNGNQRFVLNPRQPNYRGPVAVLVDELSASTSEIFAGGLQDIGRARVFGQRTAGAALPSVIELLPNGDRFQYVFANYISASGRALEGQGVQPDDLIPLDRRSLLLGRDPVLDAARAWLRVQSGATVREAGPLKAVAGGCSGGVVSELTRESPAVATGRDAVAAGSEPALPGVTR